MSGAPVRSEDLAEHFAADVALARLVVGHDALRGGHDGDAEAVGHGSLASLSAATDRGDPASLELLAHGQTAFTHAMQVTASLAAVLVLAGPLGRPGTWRVLDGLIGLTMIGLAVLLLVR